MTTAPRPQTLRMRMDLSGPALSVAPPLPRFTWATFHPARHAAQAHELLSQAYAASGGRVGDFQTWWTDLSHDPEYEADLCFPAADIKTGSLAAFARCWSSGFIKDIAVAEGARGTDLGRATMLRIFKTFQQRGFACVDLKVTTANPSGAAESYRTLGMSVLEKF